MKTKFFMRETGVLFILALMLSSVGVMATNTVEINENISSVVINSNGTWLQKCELIPSDGASGDMFGSFISMDGNFLVIGAEGHNTIKGAAYIFKQNGGTWSQDEELQAFDDGQNTSYYFGRVCSIKGNYIVIGAPGNRGYAYVFKYTGTEWVEDTRLYASDGSGHDYFGSSVAIDGEYMVVGAYGYDNLRGAIYVYKCIDSIWKEVAKLLPSVSSENNCFGENIAIYGDYIYSTTRKSGVIVFRHSGSDWVEVASFAAGFNSIAIDGNYLVTGDCQHGYYVGAAYLFQGSGSTWNKEKDMIPSDGHKGDIFGFSSAIDNDRVIVGAIGMNDDIKGAAYIYHHSGSDWIEEAKLIPSDGKINDHFGYSVFIKDDIVFIAARDHNNIGSVYIFQKIEGSPPNKPSISGPVNGKPGSSYKYKFVSTDPDGDGVAEYIINWGDDKQETITGPFVSGVPIYKSHTWASEGTYIIKAKAKDTKGLESDWGELSIMMPRSYSDSQSQQSLSYLQSVPSGNYQGYGSLPAGR